MSKPRKIQRCLSYAQMSKLRTLQNTAKSKKASQKKKAQARKAIKRLMREARSCYVI